MSDAQPAVADVRPVPLLDLKAQYAAIKDEVRTAIDRVLESQHFILGPEVEALRKQKEERAPAPALAPVRV